MDEVVIQWDSLQRKIQAWRASSSASSSVNFPFERPEQINSHVYQVHKPEGRPSIEIVFFHGLQFEGSQEAYLTTWLSAEGTELWLKWILEDVPNARILLVSYDARMDMYHTCESLVASLTEGEAKVGGDDCPVILVGHSIGGLVIKALCVELHLTVNRVLPHSPKEPVQNLLHNIRGLFFYACPHLGSRLADTSSDFPKGPLFEGITALREAQRLNEVFRELLQKYGWNTCGIGEGRPATLGLYEDFIVTEASARCHMDEFYVHDGDHFDTCRPRSRNSGNFRFLSNFLAIVLEQVRDQRSPKMSIPSGVYGLEGRVKVITDMLEQGARRLGIVGMGGIGKTTLARAVYDTISASFEYTCFLRDVKKSMAKKDNLEYLQNKIIKSLLDSRGCKVKKHFNWTELKGKKVLIVLDDVECESQVQVMLESDGFSDGSRVIVTSRESRFLYAENFECYVVKALDQEDSKRIFCLNAFHEEIAQPGYEYLVERYIKKCGGLPLALRIAGKYLYRQEKGVWDDGLEKRRHGIQAVIRKVRKGEEISLMRQESCNLEADPEVLGDPHVNHNAEEPVIDEQADDIEVFITEVRKGEEDGFFVSIDWLCNLKEHEQKDILSDLSRSGYSETSQTTTTILFARIESDLQQQMKNEDPASPDSLVGPGDLGEAGAGKGKGKVGNDCTGTIGGSWINSYRRLSKGILSTFIGDAHGDEGSTSVEIANTTQTSGSEGDSSCHPQDLTVDCSSRRMATILPQIEDTRQIQFGDLVVKMPTIASHRVSTITDGCFVVRKLSFHDEGPRELPVNMKAIAETSLSWCLRRDQGLSKVRIKFHTLRGEVEFRDPNEDSCICMVLSSLCTNVYCCVKRRDTQDCVERIILELEDEYMYPRRRVVPQLTADPTSSDGLVWLAKSQMRPVNHVPDSISIELTGDVNRRRKADQQIGVRRAHILEFDDPRPVIFEGNIRVPLQQLSVVEIHVRYKLEVNYYKSLAPIVNNIMWGNRATPQFVDFECCLEMKTDNILLG